MTRKKANVDIRHAIKDANLYHYEIADCLQIHEITLSKMLRRELCFEDKQKIMKAIEILKNEN